MVEARLLITGGAGTLGSEIARWAASKFSEVHVVDNLATGSMQYLDKVEITSFSEADVSRASDLGRVFRYIRPTHVIHAAACYADSKAWSRDLEVNGEGSLNVARLCEEHSVWQLINLQTILVYPAMNAGAIDESFSLSPKTSYAISKMVGEAYCLTADIPSTVSLRLTSVTSPRLQLGALPNFYKRITAGESCTATPAARNFLALADFLDLLDRLVDSPWSGPLNVGSIEKLTMIEVFEMVAAWLGADVEASEAAVRADDVDNIDLDFSLAEKTFGWKPRVPIQSAIEEQLRWFDSLGVASVRSHLSAKL